MEIEPAYTMRDVENMLADAARAERDGDRVSAHFEFMGALSAEFFIRTPTATLYEIPNLSTY